MLLPTGNTLLRRSLDKWFDDFTIQPMIRGESTDNSRHRFWRALPKTAAGIAGRLEPPSLASSQTPENASFADFDFAQRALFPASKQRPETGRTVTRKDRSMTYRIAVPATATLRHTIRLTLLALVGSVVSLTPLHAGVLFTFTEVGSDVVATTSGSIEAGWTVTSSAPTFSTQTLLASTAIRYQSAGVTRFVNDTGNWTYTALGGVEFTVGGSTGDAFGYSGGSNFFAPEGTAVGDAFTPNTTMTWANETFASLGLDTALSTTPLTLFTLDNGSTISGVRAEPVPEPTSIAFLATGGLAVGVVAAVRRRRRTCRSAGSRR